MTTATTLVIVGLVLSLVRGWILWHRERARANRLQDALNRKHEDFGQSMEAYRVREEGLRDQLQRARDENYARQVLGDP